MDAEPHNHKDDISAIPPPVSMVPGVLSHAFDPNDTPPPKIEGYEVLSYLGEGASGIVWRATQLSTGRQVALKLMGGAVFGTEKAKARFEREVELAARLNHPNIARLYESGIRHGYYYYAMELIEGVPLDQYVRDHHLPQDQIIVLMQKVCNAVQHAHACVVIHRDLKPTNILVSGDGEPHVLDFGLAKAADQRKSNITVTIDGQAAGTVAYMSPEQAAGKLGEIGIGSDIYSLGVILFELLTGDYPHEQSDSIYEQLVRVVRDEPRRPRSLNPALDRDLEAIILKAIAAQPEDRYASANEFGKDLQNYLAGDAVQARPLTLPYFIGKRIRKHRGRVALALVILLLFAATLVIAYVRVSHERDYANQQADAANQSLYFTRIGQIRDHIKAHRVGEAAALLDQCPAALRNWEWYYLYSQLDDSLNTLHTGFSNSMLVGLTHEGKSIIGTSDQSLVLADFDSPKAPITVASGISRATVSPDGKLCAVVRGDVLQFVASDAMRVPLAHCKLPAEVSSLIFSPDSQTVAIAFADNRIAVVDRVLLRIRVWELPEHAYRMAFLDAEHMAVATGRLLTFWNVNQKSMLGKVELPPYIGNMVGMALDQTIWVTCNDGQIYRIRYPSGEIAGTIRSSRMLTTSLAMSPDRNWIACGDNAGEIHVWSSTTAEHYASFRGHRGQVRYLKFNSKDQLVSLDVAGDVKQWRMGNISPTEQRIPLDASVKDIVCLPDSLVVWLDGGALAEIGRDGTPHPRLRPIHGRITSIASSRDGHWITIGYASGLCEFVDTNSWKTTHLVECSDSIIGMRFSPNGRWLVISLAGAAAHARIIDCGTYRVVADLPLSNAIAWSPDSRRLVGSSPDSKSISVIETQNWNTLRTIPTEWRNGVTTAIAMDRDGNVYVADSTGHLNKVKPNQTQPSQGAVLYSNAEIRGLEASKDQQRLIVYGPSVKIVDIPTLTELVELKFSPQSWSAFAWRADDNTLAVASELALRIIRPWRPSPAN